ncbi:serine/threonine-protein kinase [Actinoplanes sp. NPDC049596]|uniref:serine/threonine-protein kinase n=1 Tax=unclassified Actinoplanes TaxID=2626549 RepID=UPI003423719F
MGRTERNGQDDSLRIAERYRLVEKLGSGGMSEVWRGFDETLGRSVAVKVLSPRLAEDQSFRDRLRQEALAAARLSHPHITGIFDFGESALNDQVTVPFVVMELNDGESVSARIARQGPLSWREAVGVAVEVASALATAHARGVVHRDVTPANVMLTGAGVKVVDFGISAIVGQRDAAPDGSLLGTPAYLAPERLGGSQVSTAADVYALGLLLYRSLTGRLPWPAETTADALRAHLYADPEPLPALPGMPPAVAGLCMRCLTKDPEDRPGAAEVAHALAAIVGVPAIIPAVSQRAPDAPETVRGSAVRTESPAASVGKPVETNGLGPTGPIKPTPESLSRPAPAPERAGLGRLLLAYLGLPGGAPGPRPPVKVLRLRATLKIGAALHRRPRPLGDGLFEGGGPRRRQLPGAGHRIQAGALTLAVLAVAGISWATTRETPAVQEAQAAGAGVVAAGPPEIHCSVRYQLRSDSGRSYVARLTVEAGEALSDAEWRLQFSYPGTQRLTSMPKSVTQKGQRVTAKGSGKTKSFTLRGEYRDSNPLPLSFSLDGERCGAEVLGSTPASRRDRVRDEDRREDDQAEAIAAEKSPGQGGGSGKRNRPPRKQAAPQKKAGAPEASPAPKQPKPTPTTPPPIARKATGTGYSLAL